jgi:hypothetical protein
MAKGPAQQGALETNVVRDKAEALIERLHLTRDAIERQSRHNPCLTPDRAAAARLSIDRAIGSAQRMIDQLTASMRRLDGAPPPGSSKLRDAA